MADLNWNNFDRVSDKIEEQTDKTTDGKKLKDANEALGQLLGITDNPVFQKLNTEQQNMFLQHLVDQQGSGAADVAQKLLEGLHLRAPAPATPAPLFGLSMAPPTPGGMGGQMQRPPQQQQYQAPVQEDTTPAWFKPTEEDKK